MPVVNKRLDFSSERHQSGQIKETYIISCLPNWNGYFLTANNVTNASNIKMHLYLYGTSGSPELYVDSEYKRKVSGGEWNDIDLSYLGGEYYIYVGASSSGTNVCECYVRGLTYRDTQYKPYITYDVMMPSKPSITIDGTDVSNDIVCSWSATDYTSWKCEAIQGDLVKSTKTGTTETSCTFNDINTLGETTFKVTLYIGNESNENSETVTLTAPQAKVSNYVITGTSIDSSITVTATGDNVYNWKVEAIQDGIIKATKEGTGNTINCTFNTGELIKGGNTTFKLTYSNTWNGGSTQETVNLTYTQATISLLELPSANINTDNPFTVTWVSSNQTGFTLQVGDRTYTGTTQKSVTVPGGVIGKGNKSIKLTVNYSNQYYGNSAVESKSFTGYGKPKAPILKVSSVYKTSNPVFN